MVILQQLYYNGYTTTKWGTLLVCYSEAESVKYSYLSLERLAVKESH